MPPILHLVRHAQGLHNVSTSNHILHDPDLTALGEQQCSDLRRRGSPSSFPHQQIDLVVASPMKRTIRTALLAFGETILEPKSLQVVCLPELQETSDLPCDTGSTREELERLFRGQAVDLQYVTPGWDRKIGRWAPDREAVQARARQARVWLKNRPEKEIVCVTHGDFLHYFMEDWSEVDRTGWANAEWRSVYFTSEATTPSKSSTTSADDEVDLAHVREFPWSQQRRRNLARPSLAVSEPQDKAENPHSHGERKDADNARIHLPSRSQDNSQGSQVLVPAAV